MLDPESGIRFSNRKECIPDTYYHMDQPRITMLS